MEPSLPIIPPIQNPSEKSNPWIRWCIYEGVVILVLIAFCGFQNFSLKKTKEELKTVSSTHSGGVTIREPVYLAGKIVYKETMSSVLDTVNTVDKKKEVTVWKSGISAGAVLSLRTLDPAIYGVQDAFPLGPGTVQGAQFFIPKTGELYLGAGYRLLF